MVQTTSDSLKLVLNHRERTEARPEAAHDTLSALGASNVSEDQLARHFAHRRAPLPQASCSGKSGSSCLPWNVPLTCRLLQSALKRYRDEARPSIREPSPAASVAGQDNADTNRKKDDGTAHSTAPPAKAQQIDYDDLFADEDDLLAELDLDIGGSALETGSENRREGIMKSGATVSRPAAEGFEEDEDAEEAMRQIDEDV